MKNKTFSADSVCREGYCIIWGVILLLHHTTTPASTMSAWREKVQKRRRTLKKLNMRHKFKSFTVSTKIPKMWVEMFEMRNEGR